MRCLSSSRFAWSREEVCKEQDILAAVFQLRHTQGKLIDAVVEILAESPFLDGLFLDSHWWRTLSARLPVSPCWSRQDVFTFLQGAEQLYLHLVAEVAYFIQKDSAAVGSNERARLVGQRTGKGTFYMAEEFGSRQLFGDSSAVNGYERLFGAAAQLMDALRHILLACSAWPR